MDSSQTNPSSSSSPEADPLLISQSQSLIRLRERVEEAAKELSRLRDENLKLHEKLKDLEQTNVYDGTSVQLDADPETVKKRIEGFIGVIDQYLDNGNG